MRRPRARGVLAGLALCSPVAVHSVSSSSYSRITSLQNSRVKLAKVLHNKRGRDKHEQVLLEGHRLVCDALEAALGPGKGLVPLPEAVILSERALGDGVPEGRRLEALLEQVRGRVQG